MRQHIQPLDNVGYGQRSGHGCQRDAVAAEVQEAKQDCLQQHQPREGGGGEIRGKNCIKVKSYSEMSVKPTHFYKKYVQGRPHSLNLLTVIRKQYISKFCVSVRMRTTQYTLVESIGPHAS